MHCTVRGSYSAVGSALSRAFGWCERDRVGTRRPPPLICANVVLVFISLLRKETAHPDRHGLFRKR